MSESKYGELLADGTLLFVRVLPGPIERVWSYLTDPEKRATWLAGGETGRRAGDKIEFYFNNNRLTTHEEVVPDKYADQDEVSFNGEIIACDPPHRLHFYWPERDGGVTEVEIRLSRHGDEARLELRHKGIRRPDDLIGASGGWHVHLDILHARLGGTEPEPFWSRHSRLEVDYGDRLRDKLDAIGSNAAG